MAGTVVLTAHNALGNIRSLVYTCTADAADATFPDDTELPKFEGRLLDLVTNPGAVQPQANYAIALVDGASPRLLQVVRVMLHPGFDPAQFKTRRPTPDLAILKLSEPQIGRASCRERV